MTNIQKLFAAFLPVLAVACAASNEPASDSGESGEAVSSSSSACVDATTLTCKEGYSVSTTGCLQSRVAGAHPFGKCVKDADDAGGVSDTCVDTTTLSCPSGYEISESGCAQSRVAGSHPYGKCVASEDAGTEDAGAGDDDDQDGGASTACVDISTLDCADGITTDGCLQSRVVGAPTYGRCAK